jgi:hypothetical protein
VITNHFVVEFFIISIEYIISIICPPQTVTLKTNIAKNDPTNAIAERDATDLVAKNAKKYAKAGAMVKTAVMAAMV